MDREIRLKRLHFRAHHRGVKEADLLIGGFFDAHGRSWGEDEIVLFEALLAIGTETAPSLYAGTLIEAMKLLNYVTIA